MDQPTALVLVGVTTAVSAMFAAYLQGGRSKSRQEDMKEVLDELAAREPRASVPLADVLDALDVTEEDTPDGRRIVTITLPEHAQVLIPERRRHDAPVPVDRRRK